MLLSKFVVKFIFTLYMIGRLQRSINQNQKRTQNIWTLFIVFVLQYLVSSSILEYMCKFCNKV